MRPSRTRKPLLLNKHESSCLIYRFTRPFVMTYFLTDGLSHKITQVIKACVSGEPRILLPIVFQCFLFSKSNACVWNWLQVKPCSRWCWWLFTVFQHCSDKNSRCRSEMNILAAWQRGYTGRNVVVTILDDGIERNHPDLVQNYVRLSWSPVADHWWLL